MSTNTMPYPQPPTRLFGLWVVGPDHPSGWWWNHIHGFNKHGSTPMTFVDRRDAEASAVIERDDLDDGEVMVVALIGVAPQVHREAVPV
jgi:hypothetical protein